MKKSMSHSHLRIEQGFLLTRQARDFQGTTQIELWVSTAQGPTQLLIENERLVCFIPLNKKKYIEQRIQQNALTTECRELPFRDFDQRPLLTCYNTSLNQASKFYELCQQEKVPLFEHDIRLEDRYLMERFICGGIEFTGLFSQQGDVTFVTNPHCRACDYTPQLRCVSFDIECSEQGVLYSIGLTSEHDTRVIMVGAPQPHPEEIVIEWVPNERALIHACIQWFMRIDPDIIIGWNVIDFDFRLLHQRAEKHRIPLRLGRGHQSCTFRTGAQSQKGFVVIPGRVVLDGIDCLKTATYQFPSWSLETVSRTLLNEGKAIDHPHDRMEEINRMFTFDKPKLARYNLQDCLLVQRIFDTTHLLDFMIQRSKLTGLELDRLGGSVAAFTNLYLPQLHRAGFVAPNLQPEIWQASPGGYVMDSIPGLYDSVLVLDFKSLYPSIIRSFLIDPLGLIQGLKQPVGPSADQAVPGFRGGQFHRQAHFLPNLIETLWRARDQAKHDHNQPLSQAIKIIMNSFYGVLGSSGCRFFDTRLASSITMRGHEIMKQTKQLIEAQGYQVIYGDTDSTFVSLKETCPPEYADQIGASLVQHINQWWHKHLAETYQLTSYLEIEYETHYRKFFMPTIRGSETGSKKRYAGLRAQPSPPKGETLSQRDETSYQEAQSESYDALVFKGLESARSDWTPLAQRFQQQLYWRIFHDQNPADYIREIVAQTQAGALDAELVYRKRLRRRLHEYQKNISPQVRAARLADEMNAKRGKPLQYQNKGIIAYVMTLHGPEPVEYQQHLLDYQHYIDKQLKPIADAILPFIGYQFDDLTQPQLGLF